MDYDKLEKEEDRRLAIEHRDMLMDLRAVLKTQSGRCFIKYLLKSFDVGGLPERGVEGMFLHDHLGFLRAGRSVFEIASEADSNIAGQILAEIEGERNVRSIETSREEDTEDGIEDGL